MVLILYCCTFWIVYGRGFKSMAQSCYLVSSRLASLPRGYGVHEECSLVLPFPFGV